MVAFIYLMLCINLFFDGHPIYALLFALALFFTDDKDNKKDNKKD